MATRGWEGMSEKVTITQEQVEQLESENEKLKETLNRIRLAAASPGRSFNQRLLDIEKLARGESNE